MTRIIYVLGWATPVSFEEVKRTDSKSEAEAWIAKSSEQDNVMNVYGIEEIEESES